MSSDCVTETRFTPPEACERAAGLGQIRGSLQVPRGLSFFRKLAAFAGPGYLIAVGYMDPGNWATDLAGGSAYGYALLSVVLASSIMAMLLQVLSVRLGIATGLDLAEMSRRQFGRVPSFLLWILAELGIVACDVAEVVGTAIALELLFGLPLLWGTLLTAFDTLLILGLQRWGFRKIEAVVVGLITFIALCFGYEMLRAAPGIGPILAGFVPQRELVTDPGMLYLAIGIIGATVMPHNLYLHSALVQTRRVAPNDEARREAMRFATYDSNAALVFAFVINAAILILAASVFHRSGHTDVAGLGDAYALLTPLLGGKFAAVVFAVALLCAGQNSTLTGTLAGETVMQGFLDLRMRPWLRRLLTRSLAVIPAAAIIALLGEKSSSGLLIGSQVVLSFQLPFAMLPLIAFTGSRRLMGRFASPRWLSVVAWIVGLATVGLNVALIAQTFG